MLYFAYGSNLNHKQMARRCPNSKYLKKYLLKGYKLSFSHKTNYTTYGHANIIKNNNSLVQGALWNISKKDEKNLDYYEGIDYNYYYKDYFKINSKKVLVYKQKIYFLKKPNKTYLNTIIEGYEDCGLDLLYLKRVIKKYKLNYKINFNTRLNKQ
tara:strand:+ start:1451 stop:1915 length:465 start_codon:yes stop_codon:yes gene_type:complete